MPYKVIAFEDFGWKSLLPLVYMRATFQLRCGMFDLLERMTHLVSASAVPSGLSHRQSPTSACEKNMSSRIESFGLWCRPALATVIAEKTRLPVNKSSGVQTTLFINGRGLWKKLPDVSSASKSWVGIAGQGDIACIFASPSLAKQLTPDILLDITRTRQILSKLPKRDISNLVEIMNWPWDLVDANADALQRDAKVKPSVFGLNSGRIDPGSYLLASESIHIGEGTRIKPCVVIDAEEGPVWIGKNVTIYPHAFIQGPAFIGDGCILQPGTVIRGGNTIGPVSKVGGEIEGSIIQGFSNKQHDGFLGHSYLGSWINIAADCINSDLKNTYGSVRVKMGNRVVDTGKTFVGMFMGDFSKAGINVSFPTGSCIGFCSNIFAPVSPKYVPSFAWINGATFERYDVEKGLSLARKVMARRKQILTNSEEKLFRQVRRQVLAVEHQTQRPLEYPPSLVPIQSASDHQSFT